MNDSSRTQGGLICIGVVIVGAWFLLGLLQQSYWAIAIPVAVLVFFALGLSFWVGYTIATKTGFERLRLILGPCESRC
jgi:threonine/homoserine efflux transporter RhtA